MVKSRFVLLAAGLLLMSACGAQTVSGEMSSQPTAAPSESSSVSTPSVSPSNHEQELKMQEPIEGLSRARIVSDHTGTGEQTFALSSNIRHGQMLTFAVICSPADQSVEVSITDEDGAMIAGGSQGTCSNNRLGGVNFTKNVPFTSANQHQPAQLTAHVTVPEGVSFRLVVFEPRGHQPQSTQGGNN